MARRTRRRKVVWLPMEISGRLGIVGNAVGTDTALGEILVTTVPGSVRGTQKTVVVPVVKDNPQGDAAQNASLSDLEGSAYHLRRIVGKIFVEYLDPDQVDGLNTNFFYVTVGFIILRVEPTPQFLPLSANQADYAVSAMDAARDPWIWRRTWVVGGQIAGIATASSPFTQMPQNNILTYAGGVLDGPHIDAKTARIVSDEERLCLVATTTAGDGDPTGTIPQSVLITTDLRVLASMKPQSGNRRNASR